MGFNPPVPQQDSNWEIRVAVQLSLLLQILLIFFGPMRKRTSHPAPRFIIWACYLLADWVADLALGLLLNNMGNIGGGGGNSSLGSSFGLKRGGGGGATAGNNTSSSNSPIIFAFWTPFLLLHLGGPDTITAYSLEDNELWLRHLIGLLFELFSASVIFFCSLSGNPMIHATVLMFIVGIIKYAERTYSLYSGSVNGFRSYILDPPEPGPNYAKLMTEFDSKEKAGFNVEITIADGEASKAHKEMEEKETESLVLKAEKSAEARAYEFFLIFRRLFVNLILSFKERRRSQAFFLLDRQGQSESESCSEAFKVIEVELNFIYDMVYTKAPVAQTKRGWALRSICSGCLVSALIIFFLLDKPAHQIAHVDVGITYTLLLGGLALDAAALVMLLFSNRTKVYLEKSRSGWRRWVLSLTSAVKRWQTPRRWSAATSQLNLISRSLGKPDRYRDMAALNKVVSCQCIEDIVEDFVFVRRVKLVRTKKKSRLREFIQRLVPTLPSKWCSCCNNSSQQEEENRLHRFIRRLVMCCCCCCCCCSNQDPEEEEAEDSRLLDFIFKVLKAAAKPQQGSQDKDHIMEVCNRRGKGVIERLETAIKQALKDDADDSNFNLIMESVEKSDFDESLLLWHIATDLCLFKDDKQEHPWMEETPRFRAIAETLSEYMLYLLIKQPEMLSATAGIGLLRYRDTRAEAERFFASMAAWSPGHEDARRMLLSVNTTRKPAEVKGDQSKSVLFDAVRLAKVLRELDQTLMWEVVTEVWGEMLTYAAPKCRGNMHVRQLSRGGELITLVWFLMAHMGLGDMYQIQEGDAKAKLIVNDQ